MKTIDKMSELNEKLESVSKELEADILVYSGDLDVRGYERILETTEAPQNPNVLLLLCTPGGDPHAAFKIARRLQEQYKKFYLCIYGYCKSAGTLIAVGSDEIIMSDYAEFGPLDVQLQEKDEIWRYSSGLNIDESLRILKSETLIFFRSTLIELTTDANISTKTAAEIATNLAIGFINPIVSQIDPVRVGEIQRAVKIALAYGERLIKNRGNIKPDKLVALVQGYPDHGFAIDYQEASEVFNNVRKCDETEAEIGKILKNVLKYPNRQKTLINRIYPQENENERSESTNTGGIGKTERETGAGDTTIAGEILPLPKTNRQPG